MNEENRVSILERENAQLKEENEVLISIMAQMKVTLNRLIDRYMTGGKIG